MEELGRQTPNKQLELTVMRRRVRAACASVHCANAARRRAGGRFQRGFGEP